MVVDQENQFMFVPTGIEVIPILITFLPNKLHGTTARASVDDGDPIELDTRDVKNFLDQVLAGRTLLVEFFDDRADGPRYARFSLGGFAEAWKKASRKTLRRPLAARGESR